MLTAGNHTIQTVFLSFIHGTHHATNHKFGEINDPDTLDILKSCVKYDQNWAVRLAASQELAKSWRDLPDTLELLKDRVISDEDSFLRQAILQQVAKEWSEDPNIWDFLRDRAVNDPFKNPEDGSLNPRQTALEIIMDQYSDHPETIALLRDRVENDADEELRQFAKEQLAFLELNT